MPAGFRALRGLAYGLTAPAVNRDNTTNCPTLAPHFPVLGTSLLPLKC